jgi:hypothetical protein
MDSLPNELIQRIFLQLTPATILTLQAVSRRWQQLIREEVFLWTAVQLQEPDAPRCTWETWLKLCRCQTTTVDDDFIHGYLGESTPVLPYQFYWEAVIKKLLAATPFDDFLRTLSYDSLTDIQELVSGDYHLAIKLDNHDPEAAIECMEAWLGEAAQNNPWELTTYLSKEESLHPYFPVYTRNEGEVALPVVVRLDTIQAIHYLTYQQALGVAFFCYLYGRGELFLRLATADGQLLSLDNRLGSAFLQELSHRVLIADLGDEKEQKSYCLQTYTASFPRAYFSSLVFMQGFITAARWWGVNYRLYYYRIVPTNKLAR